MWCWGFDTGIVVHPSALRSSSTLFFPFTVLCCPPLQCCVAGHLVRVMCCSSDSIVCVSKDVLLSYNVVCLLTVLCGVGSVVILGVAWVMTRRSAPKPGLFHLFTGKYLHPQRCSTTFHWEDPAPVGTTVSFTVQVCGSSSAYFSSSSCFVTISSTFLCLFFLFFSLSLKFPPVFTPPPPSCYLLFPFSCLFCTIGENF